MSIWIFILNTDCCPPSSPSIFGVLCRRKEQEKELKMMSKTPIRTSRWSKPVPGKEKSLYPVIGDLFHDFETSLRMTFLD